MSEENKKKFKKYPKNYRENMLKTCFRNANVSVKMCYKYIFFSFFY